MNYTLNLALWHLLLCTLINRFAPISKAIILNLDFIAMPTKAEDITASTEKLSISRFGTPAEPFVLADKAEFEDSEQDAKVIQLLELVSQYEQLANDSLRVNFVSGYLDLSRANFNGSKKFGVDSLDLRPYSACKVVKRAEEFEIEDRLANQSEKRKKEKMVEKEEKGEPELRSRKTKVKDVKDVTKVVEIEDEGVPVSDPINQFGGLVPYQLRQAQQHFNRALDDSVKLLNLRNQISTLMEQINGLVGV